MVAPSSDELSIARRNLYLVCGTFYFMFSYLFLASVNIRRRRLLQILVIPGQVALQTIADVAGTLDALILVEVDHQLCFDAKAAQRLVHLLATLDGHIEIAFATEKQCGSLDVIGVEEWIGDFYVSFPCFWVPGGTNLMIVLDDVLVCAVEGNGKGSAGATGCCLKTEIADNHIVSQNGAIAPATDSQPIRISDSHLDNVIYSSL